MPNPYKGELGKAWEAGWRAAGKRHASRASNPYFDTGLKQAWDQGFDARKTERGKVRFI